MRRPKIEYAFLLILLGFFVLNGCGKKTKLITYPMLPQNKGTIDFKIYDTPKVKFVAENGINSITKDDITITIEDITEVINDERFSTTIVGPDEEDHKVGITPMMLVLKVKNNTNHIITLRQTILKIEDENQFDYPLISNLPISKQRLNNLVSKAFDQYLSDVENFFKENVLNHTEYKQQYEAFVSKLRAESRRGPVRTQSVEKG